MGTNTPRPLPTLNRRRTRTLELLFLLPILIAALGLRTWNINFDQGAGSHPDERSTACFVATTIGWPQDWQEFRDPQRSPLNPLWNRAQGERRSFTYGHFPLYLGVGMGQVLAASAEPLAGPVLWVGERLGMRTAFQDNLDLMARADHACDGLAVAGRLTIALLDTLTVLLVFLLAKLLFAGRTVGHSKRGQGIAWTALLAAGFYALTAQAIQLSHFFAMDPASTTFTVLAVLGGVQMLQRRSLAAAALCGLGAGLAISSKFSALPIMAVPVTAGILIFVQAMARARNTSPTEHDTQAPGAAQFFAFIGVGVAFVVAALAFALTSPYAVLDWSSFVQATLVEQGRMVRGIADFPFTRQYRGTTPYLYFIEQQLAWGMWWPLGSAALVGALGAFVLLLRTVWRAGRVLFGQLATRFSQFEMANALIWAWVFPYFGITGAFLAKFNRYMSPVLPFAALFAAGLLWYVGQRYRSRILRSLVVVVGVAVLGASAFWSAAYVNGVYGREHTWITASRWIYENVPEGSVILWELWDDPLPLRAMPGDPETNLASAGLTNIDWSPYEEDTDEKYLVLRERLRAADYVAYSSKRIYASVDNLPARYPMTNLYYAGMWDGSLGFEIALDVTSPPTLFGWEFDDRNADESWSLYDHPRVTVFRKVRELNDAEFDAYFDAAWEDAVPYYRGEDSVLNPLLALLGLGQSTQVEDAGLLGRVIGLLSGEDASRQPAREQIPALMLDTSLAGLPLVDDYRWNDWASAAPWRAALVWWAALWLLGMIAWPLAFVVFSSLRDRGYLFSRSLGWLLAGWLLWVGASSQLWYNTVRNVWLMVAVLAFGALAVAVWQARAIGAFLRAHWPKLLLGELVFAATYLLFIQIRILNPDLWQPWNGGEKFMEFAFLNGILRSPTFPPVDPHFAGGYINYYYYGLYLVAFVVKLTGIYAEVAFNLAVASLFALTALNGFGVVYNAVPEFDLAPMRRVMEARPRLWPVGLRRAALAMLFLVGIGNLDGFAQLVRAVQTRGEPAVAAQGIFGAPVLVVEALGRWAQLLLQGGPLPGYDFWAPSRVIPNTINEFPFWTFLFADLHPHMIVLPFAALALGIVLQALAVLNRPKHSPLHGLVAGLVLLGFVIGALAAINLWDYPTYLGIVLLVLLLGVVLGRIALGWALVGWLATFALSYLFYLPFFRNYYGIGASGIGLVRAPDPFGRWLLIWGFLAFVLLSWLVWRNWRAPVLVREVMVRPREFGLSRWVRHLLRHYDRLPRLLALQRSLLQRPTFGFLAGITLLFLLAVAIVLAAISGYAVLAVSLFGVLLSLPLLLRANLPGERSTVLAALAAFTGFLLMAGTQVVFVRDFLQGGDWYRMNTLFKFYVQIWVLWALAAGIAFVDMWRYTARPGRDVERPDWARPWRVTAVALLVCSLAYPALGTIARVEDRMMGWRPPIGTLNGMAFMEQGSYTWPQDGNRIELGHDHAAILWLLEHVRGNLVIAESAEVDYYRAGGTRIASFTGLSGLMGKHENEQRDGAQVGERHARMREFWETSDLQRTLAIAEELEIALVYVGQLERAAHPGAAQKMAQLAEMGALEEIYANDASVIYAFPSRVRETDAGEYLPEPAEVQESINEDVG